MEQVRFAYGTLAYNASVSHAWRAAATSTPPEGRASALRGGEEGAPCYLCSVQMITPLHLLPLGV